ncbi:MAG: hypothetical protein VKL20_01535 [Synechocystis sp.]|nr:hypothetical protein [Synechocystis sp.]
MYKSHSLSPQLQALVDQVESLATDCQKDYTHLLELLRVLEGLHRHIRIDYFEPALPNTRRGLYGLLKDIEESGGWPYIERGKLIKFVEYLEEDIEDAPNSCPPDVTNP